MVRARSRRPRVNARGRVPCGQQPEGHGEQHSEDQPIAVWVGERIRREPGRQHRECRQPENAEPECADQATGHPDRYVDPIGLLRASRGVDHHPNIRASCGTRLSTT